MQYLSLQTFLATLLLPLTAGSLFMFWQARQEEMFNNRRGPLGWLTGGLACVTACCATLLFIVFGPDLTQRQIQIQNGFGPGWSCQYVAKGGGPICFRDPVKPQ